MSAARRRTGERARAPAARARAAALGIGGALLLLVLVEVLLRAVGFGGSAPLSLVHDARALPGVAQFLPAQRDGRAGLIRADEERGYALAAPYRSCAEHAGTYALGEWPWRGRPAIEAATAGGAPFPTVLVLGDSNPYGIGVETADTLPERLAVELESRGHPRSALQVLNLGVPGYSTVQVERVLGPALERHQPIAVVFYVAAWNDHAPASLLPDEELLERRARRSLLASSAISEALKSLRPRPSEPAVDAHTEASEWLATGAAPNGTRVPEHEVEGRVARMLASVQASGALAFAIAPAHPASTESAYPRVVRGREAVARAARAVGALFVDADAIGSATGRADSELFVDFVHPSPHLWHAVASEVADVLAPRLPAPAPVAVGLTIGSVEPRRAPTLGDVRVTVEVVGLDGRAELPVVTVGGAPLLDLERIDGTHVAGTLMTNSAGPLDVLVQSAASVAILRSAIELVPPTLERTSDGALVVTARPHDRAIVFFAARSAPAPVHSPVGASLLDIKALVGAPVELDLGEVGRAELATVADESAWIQALVVPRGEDAGSQEARVTNALPPR